MDIHINVAIIIFGTFMSGAIALVIWKHHHNQRKYGDAEHIIGIEKGETVEHFDQRPH
jgi:hypothetical protein